jgi:two-component system, OmpR family, response regulator TctD
MCYGFVATLARVMRFLGNRVLEREQGHAAMTTKRILIVEGDMTLASSIAFTLKRHGYGVNTVKNAREALDTLALPGKSGRDVDLVIVDAQLPDKTGGELIDEIVRLRPLPPAIVMTACATKELFEALKEKGVRECLVKPFDMNELVRLVAAQFSCCCNANKTANT